MLSITPLKYSFLASRRSQTAAPCFTSERLTASTLWITLLNYTLETRKNLYSVALPIYIFNLVKHHQQQTNNNSNKTQQTDNINNKQISCLNVNSVMIASIMTTTTDTVTNNKPTSIVKKTPKQRNGSNHLQMYKCFGDGKRLRRKPRGNVLG